MLRVKTFVLIVFLLAALAVTVFFRIDAAKVDLVAQARDDLQVATEVVRLANALDERSLVFAAVDASETDGLARAFGCPATDEALREANTDQVAAVDPETGEPVVNALGQPVDLDGRPIVERTGPRCTTTAHNAALNALRAWSRDRTDDREQNRTRYLSERDAGFTIPREPDLLIAADPDGEVIARVGPEMDNWFGPSRPNMTSFPVVARAELGEPQSGVIVWKDYDTAPARLTQVGVAPVFDDAGDFIGTITIGFHVQNSAAEEDRAFTSAGDVAYYFRDGSRLAFSGSSYAQRPALLDALMGAEYSRWSPDDTTGDATATFAEVTSRAGELFLLDDASGRWLVMSNTLLDGVDGPDAGYLVVTSLDRAVNPVERVPGLIFIIAVLLALVGGAGVILAVREFSAPMEEISRGVQEVIAGNKDYMWPVDEKSHLSDLSHSLNVMSATLQGKRDPDADDLGEWSGMDANSGGVQKPAGIAGLGGLKGRKASSDDTEA